MKALVVYESMFGNTKAVAQAVAEAIAGTLPVDVREVSSAPALAEVDADLLVIGAPTHAFSLSRPSTRKDAHVKTGQAVISHDRGIREWLEAAPSAPVAFATFETHVRKPKLPGSAASAAARRLRRLGGTPFERPQTFYVDGLEGPLVDGELERAAAWGKSLARRLVEEARATRAGAEG
ncbi:MAG: flavodoxin [Actinomycetota bacterium]|nr:flavodoxin [Actinomycetota bacterium]